MPVNDRLDAADWRRVPSSFFSGVNGRAAVLIGQNILTWTAVFRIVDNPSSKTNIREESQFGTPEELL
jgi:hypothetical protein